MLLDHADFALQEQAEDNLMVAFSLAWYNSSYTIAAKPIKSLELHYTMIQFLIIHILLQTSNCTSKDHRGKIKVPDPVVKDLISSKL